MSQLASSDSVAPTHNEEDRRPLGFTLTIISPSNGVNGPLHFHDTAPTTTVKEVKAKIRDTVPSKPTDDGQRLIHHGRLLSREAETMLEVFGQEALGNGDAKTLHLVLREQPHATNPAAGSQRAALTIPQLQPRPQSTPANPLLGLQAQHPLPGFQHLQQHQALHQADTTQQLMSQRLALLQQETRRLHQEMLTIEQRSRAVAAAAQQSLVNSQNHLPPQHLATHLMPPSVRNLITQQQRDRAADGRQGVQDSGGLPPQAPQTLSGRASPNLHRPDGTTTYTREGIGPNGERWSMTVNETNLTLPLGQPRAHPHQNTPSQAMIQHPALDQLQAILRNADRLLPAQNRQEVSNNMERAASNPLPVPRVSIPARTVPPASTHTPAIPNSPDPMNVNLSETVSHAAPANNHIFNQPIVGHAGPVVYLLSSPTGPRALLLNNSDTFYTPRSPSRRRRHDEANPADAGFQAPAPLRNGLLTAAGLPEVRNRHRAARRGYRPRQDDNLPAPGNPAVPVAPHANPGAGAMAAQVGPMLWLIVRLVGFVWFFTAGNPSWSRWLMVSGLALLVFVINTGIFNSLFEQLWGPIRRHVEALIPLAGPEAAQVPAINAVIPRAPQAQALPHGGEGQQPPQDQGRRRGEPDQAQVAAHLLEQARQRNASPVTWLMTQIRRAEHAMLLFLASLVPGVGERHIAAREAEANAAEAERQRLMDAAATAENRNIAGESSEHAQNAPAHHEPTEEIDENNVGESRQVEGSSNGAPALVNEDNPVVGG